MYLKSLEVSMTHMITLKLLEQLNACEDGVGYFKQEHGDSAPLDEVLRNPRLHLVYASWLGRNLPAEYLTWDERLALQFDDEDRAWLGRYCPAGVEGATWEVRLDLQGGDNVSQSLLGRFCPAFVEGATWEARLAVQVTNDCRAQLGRICPPGVEGATLEARLAVQCDNLGRDYVIKKFGGDQ
jgi:hypothetical protein